MKLIQQLLEMAKSSSKRATQAKNRRKKKSKKPIAGATRNLVALDMQTSGAGSHGQQRTKELKGGAARREAKKNIKKDMDY